MISVLMAQSTSTTIQNPAAEAIKSLSNLDEACGDDKSWACRWIYDWTGSDTWAGVADWIVAKPLAILVILLTAFLANRLARWLIKRTMHRITDPNHQRAPGPHPQAAPPTPCCAPTSGTSAPRPGSRPSPRCSAARHAPSSGSSPWSGSSTCSGSTSGPLIAGAGIAGVALGFGAQNDRPRLPRRHLHRGRGPVRRGRHRRPRRQRQGHRRAGHPARDPGA